MRTSIVAKSENNSDLLSTIQRNEDQFPGTTVDRSICLFTHFPSCFEHQPSSSEVPTYPSLCLVWSYAEAVMWYVAKSIGFIVSFIVLEGFGSIQGGSMHADNCSTVKNGATKVSLVGLCRKFTRARSFRKLIKSDFVPPLRAPICESDGGCSIC